MTIPLEISFLNEFRKTIKQSMIIHVTLNKYFALIILLLKCNVDHFTKEIHFTLFSYRITFTIKYTVDYFIEHYFRIEMHCR